MSWWLHHNYWPNSPYKLVIKLCQNNAFCHIDFGVCIFENRIFPVKKSQISNTENDIIIIIRKALCDIQVLFILHYSCWCPHCYSLFVVNTAPVWRWVTLCHSTPALDPLQFSTHRSSLSCCSAWKTDQFLLNIYFLEHIF